MPITTTPNPSALKQLASAWLVPTVNLILVRERFRRDGLPIAGLWAGTGLSDAICADPDALVSYDQAVTFFANALDQYPGDGLGLEIGRREGPTDWGVLGFAMLSCQTIRGVVDVIAQFHQAAGSMVEVAFSIDEESVTLCMNPPHNLGRVLQFVIEEHFSATNSALRALTGTRLPIERLRLTYSRPAHSRLYEEVFQCPIEFECDRNELIFAKRFLDEPLAFSNELSSQIARNICATHIQRQKQDSGLVQRVRYLLLMRSGEFPDAGAVASSMGMTPRTLRNKLMLLGTSFAEILGEVRNQLAISYLQTSLLTNDDIAGILGYDDSSNFRRAFKRWNGCTPSEYRRAARADVERIPTAL